jgi:hypothetical protein
MQRFDEWPDIKPPHEIQNLVAQGYKELNRGLSGSFGIPAKLYANELARGPLFPGTQSAFGTGIYLTDLGCPIMSNPAHPAFPNGVATTAHEHAGTGDNGVILRCLLKPDARLLSHDDVKAFRRENRNRFREAQLNDCGSLTAAIGYDGFQCDGIGSKAGEKWYVITNRSVLIFQTTYLGWSK